jgi:hypothetical protein
MFGMDRCHTMILHFHSKQDLQGQLPQAFFHMIKVTITTITTHKVVGVFGCTIIAHWAPSRVSVDPASSELVESSVDLPTLYSSSKQLKEVQFTDEWLDTLNPDYNRTVSSEGRNNTNTSTVRNTNVFSLIINNFRTFMYNKDDHSKNVTFLEMGRGIYGNQNPNTTEVVHLLQRLLGTMVLEGLSRTRANETLYALVYEDDRMMNISELGPRIGGSMLSFVSTTGDANTGTTAAWFDDVFIPNLSNMTLAQYLGSGTGSDSWLAFNVTVDKYGYGSGQLTPTLIFGMAMVSLYLATVGGYCIREVAAAICCGGRNRGSRVWGVHKIATWNDIEDILVLALRSANPAVLARGRRKNAWREKALVRVDEEGQARLLVSPTGEDGSMMELMITRMIRTSNG